MNDLGNIMNEFGIDTTGDAVIEVTEQIMTTTKQKIQIEVCNNDEYIRQMLDGIGMDNGDAAIGDFVDEWKTNVIEALEAGNFGVQIETAWPENGRSTYHGWNGAKFSRKFHGIGTFDAVDHAIWHRITDAVIEVTEQINDKITAYNRREESPDDLYDGQHVWIVNAATGKSGPAVVAGVDDDNLHFVEITDKQGDDLPTVKVDETFRVEEI